jgi:hypothetical protein
MGASGRCTVLSACRFSVLAVEPRFAQAQSRSRARSRLARQNRDAIASWDNRACPHTSHICTVASASTCSDPGDGTSNWVVMRKYLTSATPPMRSLISWRGTSERRPRTRITPDYAAARRLSHCPRDVWAAFSWHARGRSGHWHRRWTSMPDRRRAIVESETGGPSTYLAHRRRGVFSSPCRPSLRMGRRPGASPACQR